MDRRRPASRPLALLVLGSLLSFAGPTVEPAAASVSGRYASDVIGYGNAERAKHHVRSVVKSLCLDRFAERQARDMAGKKQLYHQELRVILTSCGLREVGENVAFGYPNGAAATSAWMHSARHQKNLLNSAHKRIGVGAFQDSHGQWYVSQVLGGER
jgi:uncharacterized protein YkwD